MSVKPIELTKQERAEAARIFTIQKEFADFGFQWIEHIFNDGRYNNCRIYFTMSQHPSYFREFSINGEVGWGRFERADAWNQAYDWLCRVKTGKAECPSPRTLTYEQMSQAQSDTPV